VKNHIHTVPVAIFLSGKNLDIIVVDCLGQLLLFYFQLAAVVKILG